MLGGSDALRVEGPVLVCPEGNRVADAWAHTGEDPVGTDLLAQHLPPGVASVHAVPDHDPENRRRYPANGTLDTVRPDSQDSVTVLLHLTKTMVTARVLCHTAEHRRNAEHVNITLTEY